MRLLLIEDYPPLREFLSQGLREAGFAVDASADGEEGLWYARSNEYDAVILDLMLPKMDGLELLRRLRSGGCKTHVLILTARDTVEDRIRGLNCGGDDYLVKPFVFGELLARVRALVRRQYAAKDPVIRVADLEIDTLARTVRRGGPASPLTAKEFAILELLAIRAGQVVSRTDLWEHVYEFDSEAMSNVVEVYIAHLRRKIDRPGLSPLIHTRRGQGYVLGEAP